ncbi:unnamed protein product [Mytilus coruscus]|uniref:Uncharacterized protein n=1 Tax=Mytilus coruscus TaxID=42192 RepID=A0A6J8C6E5_MYTCO|nr:unnamed protein product [Mytilus coruscus]
MGIWYEKFPECYKKCKKTRKEIKEGKYHPSLPGPFSMKCIRYEKDWFVYSEPIKLKDFLSKLQYFAHFNTSPTDNRKRHTIECDMFGQRITFYLTESQIPSKYSETGLKMVRGKQILLAVDENGKRKMTAYADIMPQLEAYPSKKLGRAMLNALDTTLFYQNSEGLEEWIIRAASLFILLTHIPEAAIPFKETMKEFDSAIRYNQSSSYPMDKILNIKKKTGRIPMADKIVSSKLRDVAQGKVAFKEAFSEANFPIRGKDGTSKGRTWVLQDETGALTGDLSDTDSEEDELHSPICNEP